MIGRRKICKPRREEERDFYCHVFGHGIAADFTKYQSEFVYQHPLQQFLPRFFGEVLVSNKIELCNEVEEESGLLTKRWRRAFTFSTSTSSPNPESSRSPNMQSRSGSSHSLTSSITRVDGMNDASLSAWVNKRFPFAPTWRRFWATFSKVRYNDCNYGELAKYRMLAPWFIKRVLSISPSLKSMFLMLI